MIGFGELILISFGIMAGVFGIIWKINPSYFQDKKDTEVEEDKDDKEVGSTKIYDQELDIENRLSKIKDDTV